MDDLKKLFLIGFILTLIFSIGIGCILWVRQYGSDNGGHEPDHDGDGIPDANDNDYDGDGVNNDVDAFPWDPNEWLDTDGDGTGNNADTDDDDDGVVDDEDDYPLDPNYSKEYDKKHAYEQFPIDGHIDFSNLSPTSKEIDYITTNTSTNVTWAFANDDRSLYLAVSWTDPTHNYLWVGWEPGDYDIDGILLLIDGNGNGSHDENEDTRELWALYNKSTWGDSYKVDSESNEPDFMMDGNAQLRYNKTAEGYEAEFLIPLTDDSRGQDSTITNKSRFQIYIIDSNNGTKFNVSCLFSGEWEKIPLMNKTDHFSHPVIPTDLEGLIAFVSRHENEHGEIYTFDPATKVITRVTNNSITESAVALSHNRERITFHALLDPNNMTTYEIFTVNVDGSNWTQLTDNREANVHPSWSPDDTKIMYQPIYPNPPRIVIMTNNGTVISDSITPEGVRDHDAYFLPDGRITFKKDRWSPENQDKIAVMDIDGSNVIQLSFGNGISDHDPVGDETHVIFERFLGPDWTSNDPKNIITPWILMEANLDGSGERVLLEDDWMNFIPTYDPSGKYILYNQLPSYTANLLTREGEQLGRLIPDIATIYYLDWQ